ncbi:MAG TPA: hypothetical protein VHD81_07620 [Mycobacteriales bacterium]|nr:hypothetical protein [Mycobacteriales bacterium]
MKSALRDPGVRAAIGLAIFGMAGFVVIGLAWAGAADRGYAVFQLPWVVSGGLVGIGLIGLGFGLLDVHLWRRQAAVRRAEMGQVVRDTSELADLIAARVAARHSARKPAPRKTAPRKTTPRKAAPRKTAPRKAASRRSTAATK